jgi:hypothetical protein
VGMAQRSSGGTASRKATLRTITDAADVVSKSWTAANKQRSDRPNSSVLTRQLLGQQHIEHIESHPDRVIDQTCHYQ